MQKILIVDSEKCTGCRLCEVVCSVKHDGVSNPSKARIHINKMDDDRIIVPIVCSQCEKAPCIDVCPTQARFRDEQIGRVLVDYDRCIGCKTCLTICPFGAIAFDPEAKRVISCDLCDGDPVCVKFCSTQALQYVEVTAANRRRQKEVAARLYESRRDFAESLAL
jgi:Fe-S-cluster-containing hydrogenase component 2